MSDSRGTSVRRAILVVEDQAHQRELMRRSVAAMGSYEVAAAENGQLALEILAARPDISIVITDLQMPVMDGIELLRRIGELAAPPSVVVVSAEDPAILGAAGRVANSLGLQVLGSVEKPVTRVKLAPMLETYERAQAGREGSRTLPARQLSAAEIGDLIAGGALTIQVQPKLRLADGRLAGGEALVRMTQPDGGLLSPAAFIDVVEKDHGLAHEVTLGVAGLVADCLANWPADLQPCPISVNLPAACLSAPDIADRLADIIHGFGVAPDRVIWEVTETAAIENPTAALQILARLRLKRFGLAIDDFGTGHSSLDRLTSMPFSEVKLDRIFVRGCAANQVSQKIIASTASLARDLGLTSTAEGAETMEEVHTLRDLGIDVVQGFAIARPLGLSDFLAFARAPRGA